MPKPHARLQKKFGEQKRYTKLVAVYKPCRLGFNELLAYSTLIFRQRKHGYSAARLAMHTGLDRTKTVPLVLARLAGCGLVVQSQAKRWRAEPPPADISDWFVTRKAEELAHQFRYNWIMVPADGSPLTTLQAAIIPNLVLGKSHASISRFLRVSLRTVSRTAKMITDNGNVFRKDWFQDRGKVERKRKSPAERAQVEKPKVVAVWELLGISDKYLIKQLDRNSELMRKDRIPDRDIVSWWQQTIGQCKDPNGEVAEGLILRFPSWYAKIKTDHNYNRKTGKTDYDNCYRLMCANLAAYLR